MPRKTTTLAATLANPPRNPKRKDVCLVIQTVESLSKEDGAALLTALDNPRWSGMAIAKALRESGIEISYSAVNAHRALRCCCGRVNK